MHTRDGHCAAPVYVAAARVTARSDTPVTATATATGAWIIEAMGAHSIIRTSTTTMYIWPAALPPPVVRANTHHVITHLTQSSFESLVKHL